jgi:hypothetical protein
MKKSEELRIEAIPLPNVMEISKADFDKYFDIVPILKTKPK